MYLGVQGSCFVLSFRVLKRSLSNQEIIVLDSILGTCVTLANEAFYPLGRKSHVAICLILACSLEGGRLRLNQGWSFTALSICL
jgi:hypothetical protein